MLSNTSPKVHMGTITAGEARTLYAENPVVLVPMGSLEDQGPHAAMGDYILAEKMAELIAVRASREGVRTVVAPVIPFGGADHFGSMPGGIDVSSATLISILDDMFDSLLRHKLTRIVVINGHAGNVGPIRTATRRIYRDAGVLIPSLYLWRICYQFMPDLLGAEQSARVAGHGSDPLTSIAMKYFPEYLRPDMVPDPHPLQRVDELDLPFTGLATASFEGFEVGLPHEYDAAYTNGVGKADPRLCSPETGEQVAERLTEICARFVAHYVRKTAAA